MRILHLTTEFPPVIYGGLGTAEGGWVGASARAGISVAVQLVEGPLILDAGVAANAYGYGYGYGYGRGRTNLPRGSHAHFSGQSTVRFFLSSWSNAIERGIRAVQSWRPEV